MSFGDKRNAYKQTKINWRKLNTSNDYSMNIEDINDDYFNDSINQISKDNRLSNSYFWQFLSFNLDEKIGHTSNSFTYNQKQSKLTSKIPRILRS